MKKIWHSKLAERPSFFARYYYVGICLSAVVVAILSAAAKNESVQTWIGGQTCAQYLYHNTDLPKQGIQGVCHQNPSKRLLRCMITYHQTKQIELEEAQQVCRRMIDREYLVSTTY